MKKKLPEEYKSRQIKSIFYTVLLHVGLIFVFSLIKFYPRSEESVSSSYGMELNYASFIKGSDEELIPIETVSEEDIEDIIPAPSEEESIQENNTKDIENKEGKTPDSKTKDAEEKNKPNASEDSKANEDKPEKNDYTQENKEGVFHGFSNWDWEAPPDVQQDQVSEGYIVFQVFLFRDGSVIETNVTESNITDKDIIKMYKNAVLQTRFHPTSSEEEASKNTLGEIKFIIKSK